MTGCDVSTSFYKLYRVNSILTNSKFVQLKPYVSYKAENIGRKEEFTAKDLFDLTYKEQIVNEYKSKIQADKAKKE